MYPADFSEQQKVEVQQLAETAHERELSVAAANLADSLDSWRAGRTSVFELKQAAHQFQNGPATSLYRRYARGEATAAVLYAISQGVLREEEIPESLREWARHSLAPMREPN